MVTGPLLTTITDVTGVTIYLALNTLFLVKLYDQIEVSAMKQSRTMRSR